MMLEITDIREMTIRTNLSSAMPPLTRLTVFDLFTDRIVNLVRFVLWDRCNECDQNAA